MNGWPDKREVLAPDCQYSSQTVLVAFVLAIFARWRYQSIAFFGPVMLTSAQFGLNINGLIAVALSIYSQHFMTPAATVSCNLTNKHTSTRKQKHRFER